MLEYNLIYEKYAQGSLGIAVKMSGFGGESVRPHALTPKSGAIPRQILKNQQNLPLLYNETPKAAYLHPMNAIIDAGLPSKGGEDRKT